MMSDAMMTTTPDVSALVCQLRGVVDQVRDHLSGLGLARGWVLRHSRVIEHRTASRAAYRSFTTKWEARVADLEAERKAAVEAVADSLSLAGQVPSENRTRVVDVLIRLRDALGRFEYPGLLTWNLLANARLGVDDIEAAVTELGRLASGLVVLQPSAPDRPVWNPDRRELGFNGAVKTFRQPAQNQITILAAFEEEGWPTKIDAPVLPAKVADTVRRLNMWAPARMGLMFERDGTGDGIIWKQT